MDTRSKILTLEAARRLPQPVTVATGLFDILQAEHVRELREARRRSAGPLLAIVLPRANAVLDHGARAEMAAALRVIDYVVAANESEAQALIDSLQPPALVRLETADARRAAQLAEHVRRRQSR